MAANAEARLPRLLLRRDTFFSAAVTRPDLLDQNVERATACRRGALGRQST